MLNPFVYSISLGRYTSMTLPPHRYSIAHVNDALFSQPTMAFEALPPAEFTVEAKDNSSTDNSFAFRGNRYKPMVRRNLGSVSPDDVHAIAATAATQIVTINVAGLRFQTIESTLRRYPNSLMGDPQKRRKYFNSRCNEYFIDRHRTTFESILHIYQTCGQVIRPESVPISLFLNELAFYEMGEEVLENFWISEGYQKPAVDVLPTNKWQRQLWQLMEFPDSSPLARILAFVSVSVIIISIVSFCAETLPELRRETDINGGREWSSPFFWIEFFCCLWFSAELFLRFISSPSKSRFMKSFLNVLDFVAVAPFFINLLCTTTFAPTLSLDNENDKNYGKELWSSSTPSPAAAAAIVTSSSLSFSVLRIIRLVRVFRIFKLSRHSVGLQVLGKTFRASVQEFCLLIFFMGIALILFASGVYFAEQNEPDTKFTSIPASFWFVLATMTTVGYGDLVPQGLYGKLVGSVCALIGVLTLALPVPIIVANFKHFYRQECRLAQIYRQQPQFMHTEVLTQNARQTETTLPDIETSPTKTLLNV